MSSSSRIEKLPSSYSSASAECQIMCARQQSSDCTKRLNIFSKFAIEKLWQTFSGQKKISHTKRKTESSGLSNGKTTRNSITTADKMLNDHLNYRFILLFG